MKDGSPDCQCGCEWPEHDILMYKGTISLNAHNFIASNISLTKWVYCSKHDRICNR